MVHLPPNIDKALSENTVYAQKGINMRDHVCEIQKPHTPKALLANLQLLFFVSQGSTQDTTRYMDTIRNQIYIYNYIGQNFLIPLINKIDVHHLDPSLYQNFLDGYEVGSIYCYTKDLDETETELTIIDQSMGLVKPLPPCISISRSIP